MESVKLMLMLRLMPMLRLMLVVMVMVLLAQLPPLPQFVPVFQSRHVTRFQSVPQERLPRLSVRLSLTSPPLKTARKPSPLNVLRLPRRLLTIPLLLVMIPRLDHLLLLQLMLMLLL